MITNIQNRISPNFGGAIQQNYPVTLSKNPSEGQIAPKEYTQDSKETRDKMHALLPIVMGVTTAGISALVPYKRNKVSVLEKADEAIGARKSQLEQTYADSDSYKSIQSVMKDAKDELEIRRKNVADFRAAHDIEHLTDDLKQTYALAQAEHAQQIEICQGIDAIAKTDRENAVEKPLEEYTKTLREEAQKKIKGFKKTAVPIGLAAGAAVGLVAYKTFNDVHGEK